MKYRTRLLLVFAVTAFLSFGLFAVILNYTSGNPIRRQIESKALTLAVTTAHMINGDRLERIRRRSDEGSEDYKFIEKTLRSIRDANRRDDIQIAYIYTYMRAVDDSNSMAFGVDPEESVSRKSHVGDIYLGDMGGNLETAHVDSEFTEDQWGKWISAHAPVRNSRGEIVAAVGVDIAAKDVEDATRDIWIRSAFIFLLVLPFAGVAAYLLARQVSRPVSALRLAVEAMSGEQVNSTTEVEEKAERKSEFEYLTGALAKMADALQERERLKAITSKYMSQPILAEIMKKDSALLSASRRKVTVLISDIRDFTPLAEGLSPEETVHLLNVYFTRMVEVVVRNNGVVDKFIGDGLMVLFGAPIDDPFQEENAVRTAVEMVREVESLHEQWRNDGIPLFEIGIGISSGTAIVGSIGSAQRSDYTAIGDPSILASRLEQATKETETKILISEYTYVAVRGRFEMDGVGRIMVKGRSTGIDAYSVIGYADETAHFGSGVTRPQT